MNVQNRKENSYVFCNTNYNFISSSVALDACPSTVAHKNSIKFAFCLMDHFGDCKDAKKIWIFWYNQTYFTCHNMVGIDHTCYDFAKYDCTIYFYLVIMKKGSQ